jgi:hypothetical protein
MVRLKLGTEAKLLQLASVPSMQNVQAAPLSYPHTHGILPTQFKPT